MDPKCTRMQHTISYPFWLCTTMRWPPLITTDHHWSPLITSDKHWTPLITTDHHWSPLITTDHCWFGITHNTIHVFSSLLYNSDYYLKGLSHEIFRPVFWPVWIYLGLNGNRFSFLNFKKGFLILESFLKYWCVSCQTFSEILRISEKDWQLSSRFSNFYLFWVRGTPRKAAKGVNPSRRFIDSLRMIDNLFRGSPRMFFNNISVSLIQLSILLGDSTNLRERLVWNASIPKITV